MSQAVIGSYLQKYAYPDWYDEHQKRNKELPVSRTHNADGAVNCVTLRGEYLFTASGAEGFHVYDVASISNKGFSQRVMRHFLLWATIPELNQKMPPAWLSQLIRPSLPSETQVT